jgi:hypothetical protein
LITGNCPEPTPDREQWDELRTAIQRTAFDWELLDPRELRYVFTRLDDFQDNLELVRSRYQLLKDAPRLVAAEALPKCGRDYCAFNRKYRSWLDTMLACYPDRAEVIQAAIAETDALYRIWDSVTDATCEYYYVSVRRFALAKIPDQLPPPVPLWRFQDE